MSRPKDKRDDLRSAVDAFTDEFCGVSAALSMVASGACDGTDPTIVAEALAFATDRLRVMVSELRDARKAACAKERI